MIISDILLNNKGKYNRAFLIENDENNKARFNEVIFENLSEDKLKLEAKDYYLLDRETIDEIFGNADTLEIKDDDKVIIIGI